MKKGPGCVCFIMPGIGLRARESLKGPRRERPPRRLAISLDDPDEGSLTEEHKRRLLEKGKKVRDAVLGASPKWG